MKDRDIQGNILLIAPVFFDYYKEMIKELKKMNYEVDYICDAPSNSNISKAIGRINKNLIKGSTQKYFEGNVLPIIKDKKYDVVLVVGGMTFAFTPDMMRMLRILNTDAKFVLYQWDSERNLPYSTKIHEFFDEVYSFDRYDCKEKSFYRFLPLFYTQIYENIGEKESKENGYDCSYVGTAHPQKFKDINEMAEAVKNVMPKQLVYHYMPSKLKFLYHKVLSPEFKNAKMSDFQTQKVPFEQLVKIFGESKCILDAPQAGQTGLTIRTIECLGAKRKMITTNTDIRFYDFFREENILIYDGQIDENAKFFTADYVELPEELYQKYSLRNWLKTMIGE